MHENGKGGVLITVFHTYNSGESIPVQNYLPDKKMKKYFNRETSSAVVCMGKLLKDKIIDPFTPFYYSTGLLEYQDYGLGEIVKNSLADEKKFSNKCFIERAIPLISPLNQFKILQNMPLSFISIVFQLNGDNAVLYSSASGLLKHLLLSPLQNEVLVGAGKVYKDGMVETGFAMVTKNEVANSPFLSSSCDAIEIFREWSKQNDNDL